jgi:hypothetical protein
MTERDSSARIDGGRSLEHDPEKWKPVFLRGDREDIPTSCSYVGHQTCDADAELRMTMLGVVRVGLERQ